MPYAVIMEWDADWESHLRIDAAVGDEPGEGLLLHAAGPCEAGTRVLDVWESKKHSTRFFQERILPALMSLGVEPGPPLSVTEFEVEIVRT
jgi:hypothetical protein